MHITKQVSSAKVDQDQIHDEYQAIMNFHDGLSSILSVLGVDKNDQPAFHEAMSNHLQKIIDEDQPFGEDAFGNDSKYWHDEYEKLMKSKNIIDDSLKREIQHLSAELNQMKESRDRWKRKYLQIHSDFEEFEDKFSTPLGMMWPRLAGGTKIYMNMALKSVDPEDYGRRVVVKYITFEGDSIYVGDSDRLYDVHNLDLPDPDTEESILRELNPNITDIELKEALDRLRKLQNCENVG